MHFPCFDLLAAREREKAGKLMQKKAIQSQVKSSISASTSRADSPINVSGSKNARKPGISGESTPTGTLDQKQIDIIGLNLYMKQDVTSQAEELPKPSIAREKLLEEVRTALEANGESNKKGVNLVVIGILAKGVASSSKILLMTLC